MLPVNTCMGVLSLVTRIEEDQDILRLVHQLLGLFNRHLSANITADAVFTKRSSCSSMILSRIYGPVNYYDGALNFKRMSSAHLFED